MNSFVWIPSEKPARCLWDHSFGTQCEPSLHLPHSHASHTSEKSWPCTCSTSQKGKCVHSHWLGKWDANIPHFSLLKYLPVMSQSLAETFQHWEGREDKGSAPQLPALTDFVHATFYAYFQSLSYKPSGEAGRHSPAMSETLSLSMSHLDTWTPLVWDNHCPNGASFSREEGSAWGSSATEWGS